MNSLVTLFKNQFLGAILAAVHGLLIRRVEMAVKSITRSSGYGPITVVQNLAQRDFSGTRKTFRS